MCYYGVISSDAYTRAPHTQSKGGPKRAPNCRCRGALEPPMDTAWGPNGPPMRRSRGPWAPIKINSGNPGREEPTR
jgi:hypothetical protein